MTAVSGCGDGESTAKDEPVKISAASEPARVFIERMTKLLATTTAKKDCAELDLTAGRSSTRFSCPAPKDLRKSMKRFKVVGVEEYGTNAIVDYKSGTVPDGAAITLHVAPDRNWGVGRFGIVSKPSAETSDAGDRDGYEQAVDELLTAIRERDCDAYFNITFNSDTTKKAVCRSTFPGTAELAKQLKADPGATPRYQGGNTAYGFYSVETRKPQPSNVAISIAEAGKKSDVPYLVLDITSAPTAAQQKKAEKAFEKRQKPNQSMEPSSKPTDS